MADKVILVTGANRGIGRKAVERLLLECPQYRVILTARSEEAGAQAIREISSLGDFSSRLLFHQLDILSGASIAALKAWVEASVGKLDVLVNNAGIAFKGSGFDEEIARTTVGTNFLATAHVTDALIPVMKQGGRILMLSSSMGRLSKIPGAELRQRLASPTIALPEIFELAEDFFRSVASNTWEEKGWPKNTYIVSKNLLAAYTRAMARDFAGRLKVDGVDPGWVRTDMGGPSAPLSLEEGTATLMAAIMDEGAGTGNHWSGGKIDVWE